MARRVRFDALAIVEDSDSDDILPSIEDQPAFFTNGDRATGRVVQDAASAVPRAVDPPSFRPPRTSRESSPTPRQHVGAYDTMSSQAGVWRGAHHRNSTRSTLSSYSGAGMGVA